jgi:hypothetical protein
MIWCLLLLQFSGQRKKYQVISYASIFNNSLRRSNPLNMSQNTEQIITWFSKAKQILW